MKNYSERLAENAAALHMHGKLIETVVEIAWNMALARFRPNDSYEFHNLAKDWTSEFKTLYDDRVASYEWAEDDWRERCERFTQEKMQEAVLAGPEHVGAWLNLYPGNLAALYAILDDRARPYYEHRMAA